MEYVEVAFQFAEEGKYYYLLYLIQKDFYDMKRLNNNYDSNILLVNAQDNGVIEDEIDTIIQYIPVP
jgi:hypothetical protein